VPVSDQAFREARLEPIQSSSQLVEGDGEEVEGHRIGRPDLLEKGPTRGGCAQSQGDSDEEAQTRATTEALTKHSIQLYPFCAEHVEFGSCHVLLLS
jgi:hypothetical protein